MMKKILLLTALFSLLMSCSNDDDSPIIIEETPQNYFPIANANTWQYEGNLGTTTTSIDGTVNVNGNVFHKLYNHSPYFGIQGNSQVRKAGDKYYSNGVLQIAQLPELPIENELFLDENAANGEIFNDFTTQVLAQSFPIQIENITGNGTPQIIVNVQIKKSNHYDEITLNGSQVYNDVVEIDWTYQLSSNLIFDGFQFFTLDPFQIISPQQVGTLKLYYANDIGVVRSIFDVDLTNVEFNTEIPVQGFGNFDISSYLQNAQLFFEDYTLHQVHEIVSYDLN